MSHEDILYYYDIFSPISFSLRTKAILSACNRILHSTSSSHCRRRSRSKESFPVITFAFYMWTDAAGWPFIKIENIDVSFFKMSKSKWPVVADLWVLCSTEEKRSWVASRITYYTQQLGSKKIHKLFHQYYIYYYYAFRKSIIEYMKNVLLYNTPV